MKVLILVLTLFSGWLAKATEQETRTKIAVLDTGFSWEISSPKLKSYLCRGGHKAFAGEGIDDEAPFHGTNVASIIASHLDPTKFCILIIKVFHFSDNNSGEWEIQGIQYAIQKRVAFINISAAGFGSDDLELRLLVQALKNRIKISVAAGNDSLVMTSDLCYKFPACYHKSILSSNFHVVGAIGVLHSNSGPMVTHWENGFERGFPRMSGTSQAAAEHTGRWAAGKLP